MDSGTHQQPPTEKQETSAMGRVQAVQFTLSADQYTVIQHYLPRGFVLLERKATKREKGSTPKFIDHEMSRFSAALDKQQDNEGRSKRVKIKKMDRYLEEEVPRPASRIPVQKQKLPGDPEMAKCAKILTQLKKHPSAKPFLQPLDPKESGASHYYDFIKDPKDLSTIEKTLRAGHYRHPSHFHADINKIFYNSYAYNQKSSPLYTKTAILEKYYKELLADPPRKLRPAQSKPKTEKGRSHAQSLEHHYPDGNV